MFIRDTQSSRKIDFRGYRGVFFLTFGFKDVQSISRDSPGLVQNPTTYTCLPYTDNSSHRGSGAAK